MIRGIGCGQAKWLITLLTVCSAAVLVVAQTNAGVGSTNKKVPRADAEANDWNRALRDNSETGYVDFYKKYPKTQRLVMSEGPLELDFQQVFTGEALIPSASLKINGDVVYDLSSEETQSWGIFAYPDVLQKLVRAPAPAEPVQFPFARVIVLLSPKKLLCVDTYSGSLHEAARNGNLGQVRSLVKQSTAVVNQKDVDWETQSGNLAWHYGGRTALHYAVHFSHKDIVEFLLTQGADVNAKDTTGLTPLAYADKLRFAEIAELLRKHGATD